jgi:hypothetical protein
MPAISLLGIGGTSHHDGLRRDIDASQSGEHVGDERMEGRDAAIDVEPQQSFASWETTTEFQRLGGLEKIGCTPGMARAYRTRRL